ncbi:hypothetical protein [Ruegeria lacuscaerulensis]|uniref:hypothetical protein n=1 Tax=Ruegeria lacuscaerulensis TaxID=55218 RepID=UPI00147C1EF5|nr:hypothetical protein [Ruegeria lacuscaerulensis]
MDFDQSPLRVLSFHAISNGDIYCKMPEPIKIRPPSRRAEDLSRKLLEEAFLEPTQVSVQDYRQSISFNSAPGGGGAQALEWLITVTNVGLWEYLAAFLSGYAGKEFLKSYFKNAGEDFWKATKLLVVSIARNSSLSKEEKNLIKITNDADDGQSPLALTLDPQWLVSDEGRVLMADLECRALPAIAEFVDCFGADRNSSLNFTVSPIRKEPFGWETRAFRTASSNEVTIRLVRDRIEWDTRGKETGKFANFLLVKIFSKGGWAKTTQVQIYK